MEYVLEMYPELAVGERQASTLETLVFDFLCSDADFRGDDGRGNLGGIPDLRDPQLHSNQQPSVSPIKVLSA